jgi:prevent-host-death family protein
MIGVRELRERTANILRQVREKKAEYVITYEGRPVAILTPLPEQPVEEVILQVGKQLASENWESYARLSEQLRRNWPQGQNTQTVLDVIRES